MQVAGTKRDGQVEKKNCHVRENVLNDAVILKVMMESWFVTESYHKTFL
jgi:hypothetical protein